MDDLQGIDVQQPNYQPPSSKKPKNSKLLGQIIGGIVVILYAGLRLGLFGFITDFFDKSDRDKAYSAAKSAIVEYYTQPEDEPIEDHLERICSFTSEDFCSFYSEVMPAQYEDYNYPTNCSFDFLEYLEDLDIEDNPHKGMAFRVTYTIHFELTDESDQYDEVLIMVKEDGWKMYDLLTYEEYDERTTSK